MNNSIKRPILCALILIALSTVLSLGVLVQAADKKALTDTGTITSIHNRVITLNYAHVFYPDMDARFPSWAKVGARATLTYYKKGLKNYYCDIAPEKEPAADEKR